MIQNNHECSLSGSVEMRLDWRRWRRADDRERGAEREKLRTSALIRTKEQREGRGEKNKKRSRTKKSSKKSFNL